MFSYKARDVNEALSFGLQHLLHEGVKEESRNGSVLVAPGPVCIEYTDPRQRVLYSPTRDANPVFHLMEALWMLSGSNEIQFPCYFSSTYGQFSDDGTTMWDAYGWRWREFFGWDQLDFIANELRGNPTSRRCVLGIWNAMETEYSGNDFDVATSGGKAVPCNTHAYFAIRDGKLNMTVMNRSNDAMWGCFGANAVHFSLLLEYMAMHIGVPMGSYFQFTNNLHVYTEKFDKEKLWQIEHEADTVGALPELGPELTRGFDGDLALFMSWALRVINEAEEHGVLTTRWEGARLHPAMEAALDIPDCNTEFMQSVAVPMFLFWVYRKWKDDYSSDVCLNGIDAPDWKRACEEWVERRSK